MGNCRFSVMYNIFYLELILKRIVIFFVPFNSVQLKFA